MSATMRGVAADAAGAYPGPGARAETVADTGHGPRIDHAEQVNARILSFMGSIG